MTEITVRTANGDIKGYSQNGCSVFKGVPYAQPPVGGLRFRPPKALTPWEGVKDCTEFAPAAMQPMFHGGDYEIGEDCLYLNIWSPDMSPEANLPVMFWIYGGAFTWGASNEPTYDGEAICAEGCILVTINYRVNIFGFFNSPELENENGGPRCCGILDQIAALKWVRENIRQFGGNPDNIMIFGQSAGGMSVRMLLTSPLTEGLFKRAVVHSGGGLSEGDLVRTSAEFTDMCVNTLKHVGWSFEDIMSKDPQEIIDVMLPGVREMMDDGDLQYFQPFIDGYALTDVPGVSIYNGRYHNVDIMCGSVAGDSWMFSRKVRGHLEGNNGYFKGFALSPSIAWGRRNIHEGREGIYSYYFDRTQPPKEIKYYTHGAPPFGADTPHAAELAYIFGTLRVKDDRFDVFDYELAEILRKYWTNFAKYGDPNGSTLPYWPRFETGSELTMHFGNNVVKAEDLTQDKDIERVISFCEKTPGMLTSLKGF